MLSMMENTTDRCPRLRNVDDEKSMNMKSDDYYSHMKRGL